MREAESEETTQLARIESDRKIRESEETTQLARIESDRAIALAYIQSSLDKDKTIADLHQRITIADLCRLPGSGATGPTLSKQTVRHELFKAITLQQHTPKYIGMHVVPCRTCKVPRACVFDCRLVHNTKTKTYMAYCLHPSCGPSKKTLASHLHLVLEPKPNYDSVRKVVWTRQFGINASGRCCACDTSVNFLNFHCAHDVA